MTVGSEDPVVVESVGPPYAPQGDWATIFAGVPPRDYYEGSVSGEATCTNAFGSTQSSFDFGSIDERITVDSDPLNADAITICRDDLYFLDTCRIDIYDGPGEAVNVGPSVFETTELNQSCLSLGPSGGPVEDGARLVMRCYWSSSPFFGETRVRFDYQAGTNTWTYASVSFL